MFRISNFGIRVYNLGMRNIEKIYFVGIKGVGMASLATIAKQAGFEVRGSDVADEFITDTVLQKEGISPDIGFSKENLEHFIGSAPVSAVLVITTGAHGGFENPQVQFANSLGITVWTHGQAVGEFMKGDLFGKEFLGVSVAGAHGKTTTTAMLATFLSSLQKDPSYTIGTSEIFPLGEAGHFGKGKYFVAEADEYAAEIRHDRTPKLLYQFPDYAVITNIDFDHPDLYRNLSEIEKVFEQFITNIKKEVVLCGDFENTKRLVKSITTIPVATYGYSEENDYVITDFKQKGLESSFSIRHKDNDLGNFNVSVPGRQNAMNALGAIVVLLQLGFEIGDIQKVTSSFLGTKRRSEKVGTTQNGAVIMDDYAHHPVEIQTTLLAISESYPDKKIICVFQPHTFSRTQALMSEFSTSFTNAHALLLLPTFASMRDTEQTNNDTEYVANFSKAQPNTFFSKDVKSMVEYIKKSYDTSGYIIVTMGAGDVYKIGKELL